MAGRLRIPDPYWLAGFAFAGAATLIIAIVTIYIQAIKAALVNPVTSLRSE
jgi:hypothetical protein